MTAAPIEISALWDKEAHVWIATSDLPIGLCVEEKTYEALLATIQELLPELLQLNGFIEAETEIEIPCHISASQETLLKVA